MSVIDEANDIVTAIRYKSPSTSSEGDTEVSMVVKPESELSGPDSTTVVVLVVSLINVTDHEQTRRH